jgi:dolichyl-phosphate beta-glucosyltransferase
VGLAFGVAAVALAPAVGFAEVLVHRTQRTKLVISVIVPAYNESERLLPTLKSMREYFDSANEEYEVIVVDDGSLDGTADDTEAVARDWSQLRVLRQTPNRGKGAAVRWGMLAAKGEIRLFSDADLSTPIEELEKLRATIGGEVQVAIASRAVKGRQIVVHQPGLREMMGKVYNLLLQLIVLPGIHDSQCGFKLFTAEAAEKCFEPLQTERFGFDAEVLLRARRAGWKIAEVPVRWSHREDSRVSAIRDSVGVFLDLLRLRFRKMK